MRPLPPAFDADHYRRANPALASLDDEAAARDYAESGRTGGRVASPAALREGLTALIDTGRPALEIGPFCNPLLTGEQVHYSDVLDADGLRARAAEIGIGPARCPERIHHVGGLGDVAERFDAVLSSHAIEHQPDLVRHLEDVAALLDPGGRYFLIVPDRRYCLDHYLPDSSLADILAAYQEERTRHPAASVVEHAALTTHNDCVRHWRGDHGAIDPAEQARRAGRALHEYRSAEGRYVDVHSWQFTPASFATLIAALGEAGLCAFEAERVYDTPRDRNEFCAVLRLAGPRRRSPRRGRSSATRVLQTADPIRYAPMLAQTGRNVAQYCDRLGLRYEAYVGVRRGRWSWQATFNRILMLRDLLDAGFTGWALYLDADAYIRDFDFDLPAFLRERGDRAALFAAAGVEVEAWDVNAGVAFVNFGHPLGRLLVERWHARFLAIPDAWLDEASDWTHPHDQDLLQAILREDSTLIDAIEVLPLDLINSAHARFVRQHVRAHHGSFAERLREIGAEAQAALVAGGGEPAVPHANGRSRELGRLLHPAEAAPPLRIAPDAAPDVERAATLVEAWRAAPHRHATPDEAAFARLLDAGDANAVAAALAALGRSPVAHGHLGGARQHRRCEQDAAFAAQRALQTRDALFSLAEIVGARPAQVPDAGPWGIAAEQDAAALARAIGRTLGFALRPPPAIGAHLGIDVDGGAILHLRMIEAAHTAWRLASLGDLLVDGVTEIGGGVGLNAWYARESGLASYRIAAPPVLAIVQAYLLGTDAAVGDFAAPAGLLLADEILLRMDEAEVEERLAAARAAGARALFAIDHEGSRDAAGIPVTVSARVAAAGGWRRVSRARHALRAGYLEELFIPA
ncbi:hypothetical protein [Sphingomonas sp.]|uniref:hypothetical protein n=1 Tax=Sphingomonas sp. TaxID=28214 RepID=UPI003AFFEDBC